MSSLHSQYLPMPHPLITSISHLASPPPSSPSTTAPSSAIIDETTFDRLTTQDPTLHTHLSALTNSAFGTNIAEVTQLWLYILSLYFTRTEGYFPKLRTDAATGGMWLEVWRKGNVLLDGGKWTPRFDHAVFVLLCLPRGQWGDEFPGVRFTDRSWKFDLGTNNNHEMTISIAEEPLTTAAQISMRDRFVEAVRDAKKSGLKSVSGGIACGCVVRMFRGREGGGLRVLHGCVLDLVGGVPSESMRVVGKILERVGKGV
ncbi:hypothetical protein EJ08DRAFT_662915 [Tothia fuscella]|uniref:Uncharacterized protein n=1 Tax=Tothia fuscella TaxID=1048955 RepID=A0A9P4NMM9_9PEZI|nr:hypothetical protein EJ08DRAFT_662915 [Tothia fuscella]